MDYLYAQLQATMEATDSNIDKGVEMVELEEGFGNGIEEISISDVAEILSSELQDEEDEEEVSMPLPLTHTYIHC